MTEVELLPPLYRIVYEYLPVSERWYVSALEQFARCLTSSDQRVPKESECEIMIDAAVNNNMHVYLRALEVSKTRERLHLGVLSKILELDRVEMLKQHGFASSILPGYLYEIIANGAVQIMRYVIELDAKTLFRHYATTAACRGHLGCLQELARADPGYEGSPYVFVNAVASDDVKVVEFVANAWPKAQNMVPSILIDTMAWVMSGSHVYSAKMVKYMCENHMLDESPRRISEWSRHALNKAFALDSVEIVESILKQTQLGHSRLTVSVLYQQYIENELPATRVHQFLSEK